MKLNIKVDTNDGDYAYLKYEVEEDDIKDIRLMAEAIGKFKPYLPKKIKNRRRQIRTYNFTNGSIYGFSSTRNGDVSPYEYYVIGKNVSEKTFNVFKKYIKNRYFHTIHKIKLDKEVLFVKDHFDFDEYQHIKNFIKYL
jgi:hypothetical protein